MMEEYRCLVSIIVPVYNVEKYLSKCIESIIHQTYDNLEIILCDDGSTDNSPSICDEYARRDPRVKVIHKANGGLSDARNAGLNAVSGAYVSFVDSDDYLETDAIEVLMATAVRYNVPIVHMKSKIISAEYKVLEDQSKGSNMVSLVSSHDYVQGMCEKRKSESVCDKLFDIRLLVQEKFEKGRLNEDFVFLSKLLFQNLKIAEIDYSGYNYYQRPGSITNSGYGKSLIDSVKNAYELKELAHVDAPELEKHFARLALFQARTLFIVIPWEKVKENDCAYVNSLHYLRMCIQFLDVVGMSKIDKTVIKCINLFPKTTIRVIGSMWRLKSRK